MSPLTKEQKIDKKKTQKLIIFIVLVILFLVGFLIRFFPLRTGFHYWDETVYLQHAEIISGTRPIDNYNEFNIRPPLISLLISLISLLGHNLIMAHLAISLFSALGIIFIFFLGKEIFNKKIALLASFFYTFLPLSIVLSHDILVDTILPTFWILTFLFTFKTIKNKKVTPAILTGVFLGLSILLKFSSIILLPFIFIIFFIEYLSYNKDKKTKKRIFSSFLNILKNKKFWLIIISTIIILSPYLVWETIYFDNPVYSIVRGFLVIEGDATSFLTYLSEFNKLFPYVLLAGLVFLFLAKFKNKTSTAETCLLLTTIIFFFLMCLISHKEIRYLMPLTPMLVLLSAKGFFDFLGFFKSRYLKVLLLVILVFVSVIYSVNITRSINTNLLNVNVLIINEENSLTETGAWLNINLPANATIYANTQYALIAYYSNRKVEVLPFWRSFQNNLTEVMDKEGYYVLFENVPREPTFEFVQKDPRFRFIKEFNSEGDRILVYRYDPN